MDTSTLLIVFLLVTAATLASYALSHWRSMRAGANGAGWAATGVGTTFLLAAAAIVVLTFVFRGPLWPPQFGVERQQADASAGEISARPLSASPGAASKSTLTSDRGTRSAAGNSALTSDRGARSTAGDQQASQALAVVAGGESHAATAGSQSSPERQAPGQHSSPPPVFSADDPWAATRCVVVYKPDHSEPKRWKIENGCETPVALLLSACLSNLPDCYARTTSAWEYPSLELTFPAAAQRPVTLAEQTYVALEINYLACFISSPLTGRLIGASSEERSSESWSRQFDSARQDDPCLALVRHWSEIGRRTGRPANLLPGMNVQLSGR